MECVTLELAFQLFYLFPAKFKGWFMQNFTQRLNRQTFFAHKKSPAHARSLKKSIQKYLMQK